MEFRELDFTGFTGREEELRKIQRYKGLRSAPPLFPIMLYRTNLGIHSRRVQWIIEEIIPEALKIWPNFDFELARTLARVHDDAETDPDWGDVQLYYKDQMDKEELEVIYRREQQAIKYVAELYPTHINGYSYEELLHLALRKDTLEAQLVSWTDKLDGYGESIHEVLAGNAPFASPSQGYTRKLRDFAESFPALSPLFDSDNPLFFPPKDFDFQALAHVGTPHNLRSILLPTSIPHYNVWRDLTIGRMGNEGIELLIIQQEFYGDSGSWTSS